ncbi:MAG: carboxypeptidase regulatory-like domain-containing protein, partial [Acidobacteria bacterium]|nr:carboxypeptidase regulatory-like domain-containing protein [Acidobacteriota bacterium]
MIRPRTLFRIVTCLLGAAALAMGQEFRASLSGIVSDPAGAAVVGARVQITDIARNVTSEAVTNQTGLYSLGFLLPGKYRLGVEATGFKKYLRENIELAIGDRVGVDVVLELGLVTERVTVTDHLSEVQTETASRGGLVERELLTSVPNSGRNIFQLVFAMPGAMKPSVSQNASFGLDGIGNASASISGGNGGPTGREGAVELLLDGISNVKGDRQMVMIPALESVEEFQVLSNPYDAQYGHTGGGVITVTTKSGANSPHGVVFTRIFDTALAATPWALNRAGLPKPDIRNYNYGFQVNGPVFLPKVFDGRNKLFFMLSWDTSPDPEVLETNAATVPLPEMKTGDFTGLRAANGNPVLLYDPLTTRLGPDGRNFIRDAFAGNRIPANRINSVGAKVLGFYPSPTGAGDGPSHLNNFIKGNPASGGTPQWMGRLDYRLNAKHNFFGRYGETAQARSGGIVWGDGNPAEPTTVAPRSRRGRNLTMDWTATLNSSTTWNLRTGFARQENVFGNRFGKGFNPRDLNFPGSLVSQLPALQFPLFTMGTYTRLGSDRVDDFNADDTYTIQASVGKVIGRHVLKMGTDLRRYTKLTKNLGAASGSYLPGKGWTQSDPQRADAFSGNEVASLLLGYASSGSVDSNINPAYSNRYYSLFLHDNWKATRNLSLDLGLRWDYEAPIVERHNRMNRGFAFDQPSPIASKVSGLDLKGGLLFAGDSGASRFAFEPDRNNFQPRIGVAYSMNSKTVLRGGYGLYIYGQSAAGSTAGFSRSTPLIASLDGGLTLLRTLSDPFPAGLLQPIGSSRGLATDLGLGIGFNYLARSLPVSHQFSAGFQRELPGALLADVSYVGNIARGLPTGAGLNFIPTGQLGRAPSYYSERIPNPLAGLLPNNPALNGATIPRQNLLVAYPQYAGISMSNIPAGSSRYDALQASVKRRYRGGFTFQVNYMISKTLEQLVMLNPQD